MRCFLQASVSDCSKPRLCRLLLCIIPIPYSFPNPRHSHHTGSSVHLGVPCLCPIISDCHTKRFTNLGVSRLCPSITITHPYFLSITIAVRLYSHLPIASPPPFSFPQVFQSVPKLFFVASWRHHTFLLSPPPSYPVYLSHTSNKGRSDTHCATVA